MIEWPVRPGCYKFEGNGKAYLAEWIAPAPNGAGMVAHEETWRLSLLTYHKTREGRKVATPREKQRARYLMLGYWETLEEVRAEIEKRV